MANEFGRRRPPTRSGRMEWGGTAVGGGSPTGDARAGRGSTAKGTTGAVTGTAAPKDTKRVTPSPASTVGVGGRALCRDRVAPGGRFTDRGHPPGREEADEDERGTHPSPSGD